MRKAKLLVHGLTVATGIAAVALTSIGAGAWTVTVGCPEYVQVANVGGITGWTLPGSDTSIRFEGYVTHFSPGVYGPGQVCTTMANAYNSEFGGLITAYAPSLFSPGYGTLTFTGQTKYFAVGILENSGLATGGWTFSAALDSNQDISLLESPGDSSNVTYKPAQYIIDLSGKKPAEASFFDPNFSVAANIALTFINNQLRAAWPGLQFIEPIYDTSHNLVGYATVPFDPPSETITWNDAVASTLANFGVEISPGGVPEPSTWVLLTLGFAALGLARARARRRKPREAARSFFENSTEPALRATTGNTAGRGL